MKQFDFHRFVLALKCHFVTTRSIWLRVFSLQFIALFLWQLFFLWSSFYSRNYTDESAEVVHSIYYNAIDQIAGFSIVFIGIAMLFGAVCMFTGLKSTGARAAYLTLPLANAEKYVVNFLFATLFCALGSFVAYLCADALRVLIDLLTGHMVVWSVPYFFDSWTLLTIDNYLTVLLIGFPAGTCVLHAGRHAVAPSANLTDRYGSCHSCLCADIRLAVWPGLSKHAVAHGYG